MAEIQGLVAKFQSARSGQKAAGVEAKPKSTAANQVDEMIAFRDRGILTEADEFVFRLQGQIETLGLTSNGGYGFKLQPEKVPHQQLEKIGIERQKKGMELSLADRKLRKQMQDSFPGMSTEQIRLFFDELGKIGKGSY